MNPDPRKEPPSSEKEPEEPSLFSRKIPMKWIVAVVVGYMIIYNLILWFNTRGS